MLKSIVKKDKRTVTKEDCLYQIEELRRKQLTIKSLIKEYSAKFDIEEWDIAPLGALCEILVYSKRLQEVISKLYTRYYSKPRIILTAEEKVIYDSYIVTIEEQTSELKHFHGINLVSDEFIS